MAKKSITLNEKSKRTLQRKEDFSGYMFLLPALLLFGLFTFFPFIYSFILSLSEKIPGGTMSQVKLSGITQYTKLFSDKDFWNSLTVSCIYTFPVVFFHVFFGLLLSIGLNMKIPARSALRAIYFMPYVISMVVCAMIWRFMYSANIGLFNVFISMFGFPRNIGWLTDPRYAMLGIIILSIWKYVGYHTVIYLAALQDIPNSLYESADIDGANAWQKFTKITFPLLSNTTWFLIIISIINTFQAFDQVYLLTQGGPLKKTDVIVYYIYRQAFQNFNMPYASAASWVLFVIVFILTAIQMKVSKRDWDY